ncbi:Similar to hypothetical protein CHGG_03785 [Chaetomium globosum CBS 148.51]; acc. no. XP_001222999 [Pyronema omphalodes CBS 100304]|uniref:Nephrocystin 3-like N-terminal domain-containing protein n=1 Tax=Pyronema omphalodes (strain CBS 100304) TaxID=1076935 RepID=U4LPF1_PYROM|nr:Similar to hypothetical protein CHGG_03785 [Chaetomium globosum CBS 148.51]; acc. no. XP_001222999 [Pyronema omphalodes CBS 100304]
MLTHSFLRLCRSKIIDDLGKQHSDPQNPVAYFYCTEGQQRGTDPAILLATLLKQILSVQPDISDLVIASFEKHNKENSLSFEDAKSLLSETLKYLKLSSLHIVIDGIEKCDQALRIPLIRALNDLLDPRKHSITTRVKMIISSRSEELVRKNIPHCHHSLPVDESNNDSDIEQYIRQLLDYTAPRLSHMSQVREELVEEVKNKARGIYSRAQELIDSALKDRGIKSGEGTEKEPLVGASRPEHTRSGYTDILTSMIPRRNRAETMGF